MKLYLNKIVLIGYVKQQKKNGFNERVRLTEIDGEELYSQLYTTSLLTEKRLIELDCRHAYPNKAVSQILLEYAKNISQQFDNLLLIDIGKIDSKISKQAWYQTFEQNGCVVAVWPIPREQLPQWIQARANKYKLQLTKNAASFLAEYVEGNLIAASQALEKLYLLKPEKTIDETLIQTVLVDESQFTIFDLSENIILGDKKRSLHILEKLQADGVEPTLILWSITRELRLLAELSLQLKQGVSLEILFQKHKVFAKRQPGMRRFLMQHPAIDCYHYLQHAMHIDQLIKGVLIGNVWDALHLFCLRL